MLCYKAMNKPETLRLYASIFDKPTRDPKTGLRPASEISKAAAEALRLQADALDTQELRLALDSL